MPKAIKPEDRMIYPIPDYTGAGIYLIRNLVNGKVYIGSARNVRRRIIEHDIGFRKGYCNNKIQADIDLGHKFTCEIVEKCDNIMFVELRNKEEYYTTVYDSFKTGYNTAGVQTYDFEFYKRFNNQKMIEWLSRKV